VPLPERPRACVGRGSSGAGDGGSSSTRIRPAGVLVGRDQRCRRHQSGCTTRLGGVPATHARPRSRHLRALAFLAAGATAAPPGPSVLLRSSLCLRLVGSERPIGAAAHHSSAAAEDDARALGGCARGGVLVVLAHERLRAARHPRAPLPSRGLLVPLAGPRLRHQRAERRKLGLFPRVARGRVGRRIPPRPPHPQVPGAAAAAGRLAPESSLEHRLSGRFSREQEPAHSLPLHACGRGHTGPKWRQWRQARPAGAPDPRASTSCGGSAVAAHRHPPTPPSPRANKRAAHQAIMRHHALR
jgi:hypothetical protein